MHKKIVRHRYYAVLLALAVVLLDQASKWWILLDVMNPPHPIPVTGFFSIVLAWNRGVSFSMLNNLGAMGPWILVGLSGLICVILMAWFRKALNLWLIYGLAQIIGGAAGNIFDRIYHGAVVDFLYFYWGPHGWPAFNMADTFITTGVGCILIESFLTQKKGEKSA